MNREHKDIRVHTKVDASTFRILNEKADRGGFSSVYKLVQIILEGFCRYEDKEYDKRFADGMRQEIDEMFEEIMADIPRPGQKLARKRGR